MIAPFSRRVTDPAWRSVADAWIGDRLGELGVGLTGAIEQPRARPWSTQLTVPTDSGVVWFKANAPSFAFEAALQSAIARLAPEAVQPPIAIDADRGWMLTADHGPTMGDTEHPDTEEWSELLTRAARAQRVLAERRTELLASGLPDRSPHRVVGLFDALRAQLRGYGPTHPGHLSPDDDALLEGARGELAAAAERLASGPYPPTWNHGDLHPFNAYRGRDGVRFFDLGDGGWANALEILAVPLAWMRRQSAWPGSGPAVDEDAVLDAYASAWGLHADPRPLLRDMFLVHAVNRAQTWAAWLDDTTPEELEQYGGYGEEHLTSVLDLLALRTSPGAVEG